VGALATDNHYTCAILADESEVWCWGYWTNQGSPSPVRISPLTPPVTSLAAGAPSNDMTTCAVTGLGGECWGTGVVAQPQGLADTVQFAMGPFHACALTSLHVVQCWGLDLLGEVGVDTDAGPEGGVVNVLVPTVVANLGTDVEQIAVGFYFSCALRVNGEVWCWGKTYGYRPTLISELNAIGPATRLFGGGGFACALVGGAAYCWGENGFGQIGNGQAGPTEPVTKVGL
jgi:hypothetical protein